MYLLHASDNSTVHFSQVSSIAALNHYLWKRCLSTVTGALPRRRAARPSMRQASLSHSDLPVVRQGSLFAGERIHIRDTQDRGETDLACSQCAVTLVAAA